MLSVEPSLLTFRWTGDSTLTHVDDNRRPQKGDTMRTKFFALVASVFALFATTAAAATKVAATGCCPLCK